MVAVLRVGAFSGSGHCRQPTHAIERGRGKTYPDQLGTQLGDRLVLGQGHVRKQRRVSDDARVRVAVDVCLELPACGVGVACADVLCLEPLELLLGAEFVGLILCWSQQSIEGHGGLDTLWGDVPFKGSNRTWDDFCFVFGVYESRDSDVELDVGGVVILEFACGRATRRLFDRGE